ncbi:MAG: replicative DNA helicase [Fimbriimonadales bacterium]
MSLESLLPPHSEEAEAAALGSMLVSRDASDKLIERLTDSDFYNPTYLEIFRAIVGVSKSSRVADLVTVSEELKSRGKLDHIGGADILVQLASSRHPAGNADYYADIILEMSTLRGLQDAAREIERIVHDPVRTVDAKVDEAEQKVFEVATRRLGKDFIPIEKLAHEFFEEVDLHLTEGRALHGVETGFKDLDRQLSGFYDGNLVILAARPAVGKTSLALSFALSAARTTGKPVAFFSLEMSDIEIVRRLVCMEARVDSNVLKRSKLANEDYQKLADACDRLYKLKLYVDDSGDVRVLDLRGKCRRLAHQAGGLGMIVIDHLQLMRAETRNDNRVQQISEIARSLKNLAKELNVPIIALSQLSRGVESRTDKRPLLSDLRESGSIEADADVVMLLYREDYYNRESVEDQADRDPKRAVPVEVIIGKNRNGPVGTIELAFQPAYTRFSDFYRGQP